MQDRFKFRVWCKTNQEWEKGEICITNKERYIITNPKFTRVTNIDPQYHEINFCSGLKDKNGKLIYESDILKFRFGNSYRIGIVKCVSTIWDVSNAQIVQGAFVGGALINCHKNSEVIGNIYENPELLKDNE